MSTAAISAISAQLADAVASCVMVMLGVVVDYNTLVKDVPTVTSADSLDLTLA
jgi:hypothetical protein